MHVENFHFKESFCFHTIQLYDFHPLPLDILTHEAEALVFKVILELRINLHEDKVEVEHQSNANKKNVQCCRCIKRTPYLKAMSVPFFHILCISIKFACNTDQL